MFDGWGGTGSGGLRATERRCVDFDDAGVRGVRVRCLVDAAVAKGTEAAAKRVSSAGRRRRRGRGRGARCRIIICSVRCCCDVRGKEEVEEREERVGVEREDGGSWRERVCGGWRGGGRKPGVVAAVVERWRRRRRER